MHRISLEGKNTQVSHSVEDSVSQKGKKSAIPEGGEEVHVFWNSQGMGGRALAVSSILEFLKARGGDKMFMPPVIRQWIFSGMTQ